MKSYSKSELDAIWLKYGASENANVRQKLVILSALEIAEVGILEFNSKNPCNVIDAKTSIVNYYFGGREGLLAESAAFVHDEWLKAIQSVIKPVPQDPIKQLKKIINVQLTFAAQWKEMGVFASYPNSSPLIRKLYFERFGKHTKEIIEYYLAVLTLLIADAKEGRRTTIDFQVGTVPKQKAKLLYKSLLAATSFSWSVHGLFVWTAGQHAPSHQISDKNFSKLTEKLAIKNHIDTIIDTAINS
jgi:hypothetical protein